MKENNYIELDENDLEYTREELEIIADDLAKTLDCKDRFEMFDKFDNNEFDGLDIEMTISAYKHLLSD